MAANSEGMKGPRLEYVVRQLKGKIKVAKRSFNPKSKKVETTLVPMDAGFLLYMPNGHSYRLTKDQIAKYGYDRQPTILNFDQVNDTKTPAGRYKFAMDDATRQKAWKELEDQVIRSCIRRHGPVDPTATGAVEHDSESA